MSAIKERFKIIPAVYLVLKKDGKILLSHRCNTGYEDGNYILVSGHLEGDESFRQAMAREAKEEANLVLEPDNLKVSHIMHRKKEPGGDSERIDIFLTVKKWKGEPKNMELDKCDDLGWFSMDNLPENIVPYVKYVLKQIEKNEFYSEWGF
ncbi:MAG: NUDIX domain-containing protein [Candidatus Pacebacteria bacterium]|nr:NUDIX domain-containing protein [Candidatus Paceibacterota bacterium]